MNMSFLRHSYRPSNASDFGDMRKTEQKLEEYVNHRKFNHLSIASCIEKS